MSRLSQLLASFTPEERITLEARFWAKVYKRGPDDCWLWMACIRANGCGGFSAGKYFRPLATRVSWELANGPVPDGLEVCHSCDSRYPVGDITYRRCVNPAHLWLGTHQQNMADASNKGRMACGKRSLMFHHPGFGPAKNQVRGTQCYLAKLDDDKVRLILRLTDRGLRLNIIAALVGIHASVVCRVASRKAWGHVTETTDQNPPSGLGHPGGS